MKKLALIILTISIILSLVACEGTDKKLDTFTLDINSGEVLYKDAKGSVPGTNVFIYPNSLQVYSSKDEVVYATTDSGSGSIQEGYYYYTTLLTSLMRDLGTDMEKSDEIKAYIDELGGLQVMAIYDINVDSKYKEDTLGFIFSKLPTDKTIILYSLVEEE